MEIVHLDRDPNNDRRTTTKVQCYIMNWEDPDAYGEVEQLHNDFHRIVHQVMPWAIMDYDTL